MTKLGLGILFLLPNKEILSRESTDLKGKKLNTAVSLIWLGSDGRELEGSG